ncbi:MAG: quinoprotein ethanol dehydrogenase [Devosia sp.]|uniref:pyrroloquinoline quinone-dependent dehydrogenase n=1 Tax=Devosia sp. TaxID=1871048 RepID=UPI002615AB6C|nr:PQQ-binding-like beta-propeller repeat protein [Devosia sp.]MDB5529576.1 quinoprotein ethanol dehydrogenase [Devosia sp.]
MTLKISAARRAALAGAYASVLLAGVAAMPAVYAAEVTGDRIVKADSEPQNWLTNNRDYTAQRFSPLDTINKTNASGLKLLYSVALNNLVPNYTESTPLAEDGFLYLTDTWGVVYKIDATSGDVGRIVWSMDPGQEKASQANRGVALAGDFVISVANGPARLIASSKETGEVMWEKDVTGDTPRVELTGAPLLVNGKILVGAAGGDAGTRTWLAAYDVATGDEIWKKYNIPAPGEPGSETWTDGNNAWETGGGAMYTTGSYDPAKNQLYWGTGNPVPPYDPSVRAGDNLFTNSVLSRNPDTGDMNWYFQYTPNDAWDYDESGTHILFTSGDQTLITHSGRNGFLYTFEADNGLFLKAEPYAEGINWTKGIDPKTGKPLEYDSAQQLQTYSVETHRTADEPTKRACPANVGGNNFWPSTLSRKTNLIYIPAITGCVEYTTDPAKHTVELGFGGGGYVVNERLESELIAADPVSGEIKKRVQLKYPNYSGALSTAGGLVFTALMDGTLIAFDDETLDEVWKINVGVGFTAPPMTFAVGDKQYIAIASGLSGSARGKLRMTPELAEQRNSAMLFVFGL